MLPPTSSKLLNPDAVPYFLWDDHMTVRRAKAILEGPATREQDELVARILREANTRDVWLFLSWSQIDEAWPRIEKRLGRARGMWTLLRSRHLENMRVPAA
jgi:hypothetical protein